MAIVMTSTSPMSSGEYDEVITHLAPRLSAADGFIAHYARPATESEWTVVEIWETAEQQAAFFDANVRPHLPEAVPAPAIGPVHNVVLSSAQGG